MKLLEKDAFNYWEVKLILPSIEVGQVKLSVPPGEDVKQYGIEVPTSCTLMSVSNILWTFSLCVLGFGFRITRQWGY
tara:strand:+ start:418 stop:648 length:231 start_codon:yes stop_codon:yes gene_type:complete